MREEREGDWKLPPPFLPNHFCLSLSLFVFHARAASGLAYLKSDPFLLALIFLKYSLYIQQRSNLPQKSPPSHSRPVMPPAASPWDPEDVLNLGQVSAGVRCVGDIKSRRRQCRNPIAATNCQRASNLIFRMSRLDPSSSELNGALDLLARLLLCKKSGNRDQVGIMVAKWRSRIQQFQVVAAARGEGAVELEVNARLERDAPDQHTRHFQ